MKNSYLKTTSAAIKALFLGVILFTAASVNAQCSSSFTWNSTGNVVNFMSTSTTTTSNSYYYWTFGDGSTGWGSSVNHTYTNGNMSLACLMLIDSTISCSSISCDTVYFSGNPTTGPCNPNVVFYLSKDSTQTLTWDAYAYYPPNVTGVQWSWGDGTTSSSTFPSHTYASAGTYSICVSVTATCNGSVTTGTATYCNVSAIFRGQQDNSMIKVNVRAAGATGFNTLAKTKNQFNIYPNPGTGLFTLELGDQPANASNTNVYVYNMLGELIFEKPVSAGVKESVDLSGFDNGTYFVKVVSDKSYTTKKISVQK